MATDTKPPAKRGDYVPKHAPARAKNKGVQKKKSFLRRRWWLLVLLTPVALGIVGAVAFAIAYSETELPNRLPPIRTTYVYDRDGELITTLHGAVDRTVVSLAAISQPMRDAVIATEDHDFYEHPGFDPVGVMRAAWTNFRGTDNEVQGASTITQQVVKNIYAGEYVMDPDTGLQDYIQPQRSVSQKVREILLAMKLEQEYGKDRILALYLNTVYFGHGAYGVEAAAQTYFGKHARNLTVLEAATLAGVLHAPEDYDPIDRPEDNVFRRDYALDQMALRGYITAGEAQELKAEECCGTIDSKERERLSSVGDSEYFVDHVRRQLFEEYGEARVYGGGLRVTTSLDLSLQAAAEDAIATNLPDEENDPAAALVAMDPATGEILAMVGGRDWETNKVNFATGAGGSGRQAGSAFKAFTLAAAIQEGYDLNDFWVGPNTMPIQGCIDPESPDGLWHPVNAEGSGTYSLADATSHSVNTIFAQLIAQLGPDKVVDMAHQLGIRSDLPEVCSITLGSVAVNPLEMTNGYATLAARGIYRRATPLIDVRLPGGRDDTFIDTEGRGRLAQNDADLVTDALRGVISGGTGSAASIYPIPAAGKTGTANENVDAWFCGYTTSLVTCVWMGWPEGEIPLENIHGVSTVYGGTIPAAIWHDFMSVAMEDREYGTFPTPSFDGYTIGPETPVPSPTPSPTFSPTPSPTPSPSPSPTPTPTPTPTVTPTPTTTGTPEPD